MKLPLWPAGVMDREVVACLGVGGRGRETLLTVPWAVAGSLPAEEILPAGEEGGPGRALRVGCWVKASKCSAGFLSCCHLMKGFEETQLGYWVRGGEGEEEQSGRGAQRPA